MCKISITLFFIAIVPAIALADENKWVWKEGGKAGNRDERKARYLVHEYNENLNQFGSKPFYNNRPHYQGNFGPGIGPSRPSVIGPEPGILVGPGGPTGIVNRPLAAGVKENFYDPIGPHYENFDTCKCTYSFNCPSFALNFGSCSNGKRYCCYNNGNKFPVLTPSGNPGLGSHASYPDRPYLDPLNFSSLNYYGRPQSNFHGDYQSHPGQHYRPDDINYERPYGERPYKLDRYENQRPLNPHYQPDFYPRSANKEQVEDGPRSKKFN